MALKHFISTLDQIEVPPLAVPSYGAMALKLVLFHQFGKQPTPCSPLLRGDGPETA